MSCWKEEREGAHLMKKCKETWELEQNENSQLLSGNNLCNRCLDPEM